jgi:hypothetical protein
VHDILARQMIGQWLAERLGGVAGADDGRRCLGDRFDLGVFETQPQLVRSCSISASATTSIAFKRLTSSGSEAVSSDTSVHSTSGDSAHAKSTQNP